MLSESPRHVNRWTWAAKLRPRIGRGRSITPLRTQIVESFNRLFEQEVPIAKQDDNAPEVMAVRRGHAGTLAESGFPGVHEKLRVGLRVAVLLEPSERVRLAERPGLERGVYLRLR